MLKTCLEIFMNQNIQNHQYKGPPGTKQKKAVSKDSSSDVLLYEKKTGAHKQRYSFSR